MDNDRKDVWSDKVELSRREFNHKGVDVIELLYQWEPSRKKLLWVRPPLEKVVLSDGVTPNPIVHVDVTADGFGGKEGEQIGGLALEAMQRRCQEEFDRYWKL